LFPDRGSPGDRKKEDVNMADSRKTTLVLSAVLVGASLVAMFYFFVNGKKIDNSFASFFITTIGVTTAVTSVVMSSHANERNAESSAKARKTDRALAFIATWNNQYYSELRRSAIRPLGEKIKDLDSSAKLNAAVNQYFTDNPDVEEQVSTVLNFMEEIGLAVQADLVDEEIVYTYFGDVITRLHAGLNPWICTRRIGHRSVSPKSRAQILIAFTTLAEEWGRREG
jgi:hypothetical protein